MFNAEWYSRAKKFIRDDLASGNDLSSYNNIYNDLIAKEDYEGAKAICDMLNRDQAAPVSDTTKVDSSNQPTK
jgi:hypothetical protein